MEMNKMVKQKSSSSSKVQFKRKADLISSYKKEVLTYWEQRKGEWMKQLGEFLEKVLPGYQIPVEIEQQTWESLLLKTKGGIRLAHIWILDDLNYYVEIYRHGYRRDLNTVPQFYGRDSEHGMVVLMDYLVERLKPIIGKREGYYEGITSYDWEFETWEQIQKIINIPEPRERFEKILKLEMESMKNRNPNWNISYIIKEIIKIKSQAQRELKEKGEEIIIEGMIERFLNN